MDPSGLGSRAYSNPRLHWRDRPAAQPHIAWLTTAKSIIQSRLLPQVSGNPQSPNKIPQLPKVP